MNWEQACKLSPMRIAKRSDNNTNYYRANNEVCLSCQNENGQYHWRPISSEHCEGFDDWEPVIAFDEHADWFGG